MCLWTPFLGSYDRNGNLSLHKHLCMDGEWFHVYNSRRVETKSNVSELVNGLNKQWYIHAKEYYSAIKKEYLADMCYNMNRYASFMLNERNWA